MTFPFVDGFFMVNELPDGRCWCFLVDFLWYLGWDCSTDYYYLTHLLEDVFPLYLTAHKHVNNFHIDHLYVYHHSDVGRHCCRRTELQNMLYVFFSPTVPSVCSMPAFNWMLSSEEHDLGSMLSFSFKCLHCNFSWMTVSHVSACEQDTTL